MKRLLKTVLGVVTAYSVTTFAEVPKASTERFGVPTKGANNFGSYNPNEARGSQLGLDPQKGLNLKRLGPGEAGGGGTTVTTNGRKELLDIYIFKKTRGNYSTPGSERGVSLPSTRALSYLHIDKLNSRKATNQLRNTELLPVQIALQKIEALWGSQPPPFIQSLKSALQSSPIYYMDYRFTRKDGNAWIPSEVQIPEGSLDVIAYYIKDMGMLVSKKDFESLDLFNQVAFVIHESLRQMQYTYEMGFSNEDLQTITANIAFDIPFLPEGIENSSGQINGQTKAIGMFNKAGKDACKLISRLPYQNQFAESKAQICNAPLFDQAMNSDDSDERHQILSKGLDHAIIVAITLSNEGKLASEPVSELMEFRVAIVTANYIWSLSSQEMKQALNIVRDATVGLNHFSFDAVMSSVNRGESHPYSSHLKSVMEGWRNQGILKD